MDLVLRVELFSEFRADALGESWVDALEARIADIFIANGRDIRRGGLHFSRALEAGLRPTALGFSHFGGGRSGGGRRGGSNAGGSRDRMSGRYGKSVDVRAKPWGGWS